MGTTSCCKGRFSFQLLSSQPKATMFLCSPKPEIVHLPAHTTLKRAWRVGDSQPQCWEGDLPPVRWDGPMSPLQPLIDSGIACYPMAPSPGPLSTLDAGQAAPSDGTFGAQSPCGQPCLGTWGTSDITAQHHHSLLEIQSFWGLAGTENFRITLLLCKTSPSPSPVSPGSDPSPCIPNRLLKKATRDLSVGVFGRVNVRQLSLGPAPRAQGPSKSLEACWHSQSLGPILWQPHRTASSGLGTVPRGAGPCLELRFHCWFGAVSC